MSISTRLATTPEACRGRSRTGCAMKPVQRILRVLIADDEMLARQRLQDLLAREKAVEIVGQIDNGEAAVAAIEALNTLRYSVTVHCGEDCLPHFNLEPRLILQFRIAFEQLVQNADSYLKG